MRDFNHGNFKIKSKLFIVNFFFLHNFFRIPKAQALAQTPSLTQATTQALTQTLIQTQTRNTNTHTNSNENCRGGFFAGRIPSLYFLYYYLLLFV